MEPKFKNRDEYEKWKIEKLREASEANKKKPDQKKPNPELLAEPKEGLADLKEALKISKQEEYAVVSPRLTKCQDCGNEVSKCADKCPHCGALIEIQKTGESRIFIDKPAEVKAAIRLLYVSLIVGVLNSLLFAKVPVFILFGWLILGLIWVLIFMISRGKNWARITFLILFIAGIPIGILSLPQSFATNPLSGFIELGISVLDIIALVFLFRKSSSDWFKQTKNAPVKSRSSMALNLVLTVVILFLMFWSIHTITDNQRQGTQQVRTQTESPSTEKSQVEPSKEEYREIGIKEHSNIADLTDDFKKMTEIQQKKWCKENEWRYHVMGYGKVSEVEYAGLMAEINGSYYEVTIELENGNRAVVFYPRTDQYGWVENLSKGSYLNFEGRLKTLKNWGFWISGYVRG